MLSPVVILARGHGPRRGVPAVKAIGPAQNSAADALLEPNKIVEGEIAPGQAQSYRINLEAGQYARVVIEHWGADLRLAFQGPGGRVRFELNCRQNGTTPVSLLAETSGAYRLELRARAGDSIGGRYRGRIEEVRRATAQDQSRLAAEKSFAEADGLRAEERAESSRQAIKKYEEAAALWQAVGDKTASAAALKNVGEVYQELGNSEKAFSFYKQALAVSQEAKDVHGEAEILNDIGYLHFFLGDMENAFQNGTRALKLGQETGDRRVEAQALNTIGEAYFGFADFPKDIESQDRSIKLSHELNDRRGEARALVSLGYAYAHLSELEKALNCYNEAVSLWREVGSPRGQALTFIALGNLKNNLGEKQESFNLYQQARQLLQPTGDLSYNAYVHAHIARSYRDMGELQLAIENNEEAIKLFQMTGNRWGDAEGQLEIGRVYYSSGDNAKAIHHYGQALIIFRSLAMPVLEAQTLRDIGLVYDSQGDKTRALDHYNQALRLFRDGQDRRDEAYTLNYIGRVHESSGEWPKALDYYTQALALHSAVGDRHGMASTLYDIAHAEGSRGNLDAARSKIESAIQISETLRTKVASNDLRASFLASTHQQYEFYTGVLMRLFKQRPAAGFDVAAFEASERGRARSLLESLAESRAGIRQGVDAELLKQERELQRQLNAATERRFQLAGAQSSGKELAAVEKELAELATDYQQVQGQIRASSPRYAALVQPVPLTLKQIQQQVLDADTVLLEYSLGEERSFVWAVTTDSIKSFELPARSKVEAVARRVYELLTARNRQIKDETEGERRARLASAEVQYAEASRELSALLLSPVASELQRKRLVVVADGALQYVPIAALPEPEDLAAGPSKASGAIGQMSTSSPSGPRPLIVEHEIVSLPSASVLALMREEGRNRQPAPKSVAVLADPVFDKDDERLASAKTGRGRSPEVARKGREELAGGGQTDATAPGVEQRALRDFDGLGSEAGIARLPFSRREAEAIMAAVPTNDGMLALGFRASRATATSPELSRYRIVHFAAHGLLNSEHPELSGIVLSLFDEDGKRQDGFLQLHEIYNLDLPADLVVLSACQTALGKEIRGEGLVGLTRGFMYAGAPRVIASLWKVDDAATAGLMGEFYRAMLGRGLRPAAALRAAQIKMWEQQRWHSPYYWAAFTLQGEWK